MVSPRDDDVSESYGLLSDDTEAIGRGSQDDDSDFGTDGAAGHVGKGQTATPQPTARTLTLRQAARLYPTALFWCLVTSASVMAESYNEILIPNLYAYPAFAYLFGHSVERNSRRQFSAAWQAALRNGGSAGALIGVLLAGVLLGRLGHRNVLLAALLALCAALAVPFTASRAGVLLLGELLCGVPWGLAAVAAPTYASEVLPLPLRPYVAAWTNACVELGQLLAAVLLTTLVGHRDAAAFRVLLALPWAVPALLVPVLLCAPASPWRLVRAGQPVAAEAALRRLQRPVAPGTAAAAATQTPAAARIEMEQTDAQERRAMPGTGSDTGFGACLRAADGTRRRTEIACMAFAGPVLAGAACTFNAAYFLQQAGLPPLQTYLLPIGQTVLALAGTLVHVCVLLPRFGVRPIFLGGLLAVALLLAATGVLHWMIDVSSLPFVGLTQGLLALISTFVWQMTVGPLGWAISAQVSATRQRYATVSLARGAFYVAQMVANVLVPALLGALGGFAGFVWGGTAALAYVWAYYRLPELQGRTYAELGWLFAQATPTWAFATAVVPAEGGEAVAQDGDEDAHELDSMVFTV